MKQRVSFKLPVYKDQGTASNYGVLIAAADTARVIIRNDGGTETTQDLTVTAVTEGGRTIEWDNGTTGNLQTEDIVRIHKRHQWNCSGPLNWAATLTESGGGASAMGLTSMKFGGVVYTANLVETTGAAGIQPAFAQAIVNWINGILGKEGTASYVITGSAGTQILAITIMALTMPWDTIVASNATVGQPATF